MDEVEFVVHHPSVPEIVAFDDSLGVGSSYVDGCMLVSLGVPVFPKQFCCDHLPNRYVFAGGRI
jgi:hypothetical protein